MGRHKSIPDPIERKLNNFFPNPLTDTKQESYDAGYDSIKAVERGADIYTIVKGGAKLIRNLGKLAKKKPPYLRGSRKLKKRKPVKEEHRGYSEIQQRPNSALAKVGDGKFKTNAIRFPTNFESLGSYLQSVARKMNIRITRRSPIFETAGGHYRFHDPGPDVPHSKGSGAKISPERQKQIDALESGEYTGKGNKGTEKTSLPKPKPVEPRGKPIEFIPAFKQEELALKTYEKLRATGLDMKEIETFAQNTGLSVKEAEQLKTHLILTKHVNLPDHMYGKYYYEGYFDPNIDIAHGWEKALKGELSPEEKNGLGN